MGEIFWIAVFGAGIFQGLFLCAVAALSPRTNRRAARPLAALLALMALALFAEVIQGALDDKTALLVAFLNINTELAFGPLIFLTFRSLLLPDRAWRGHDLLHFLPFAAGVAAWTLAYFVIDDHEALYRDGFVSRLPLVEYLVVKAGILFAYLFATWLLLSRAEKSSERLYTARHSVRIRTLRLWIVAVGAVPVLIYLVSIAEGLGIDIQPGSDQIGGVLIAVLIFLAGWVLVSKPWLLSLASRPRDVERRAADADLLGDYLRDHKPWLDQALSRPQLAAALGWSESHLSSVIGIGLDSSFYDLINRYRLDEFERLAGDAARRGDNVMSLAFDSGFNSKAAFYRAFKDRHHVTPTQFRNQLLTALSTKASH